VFVPPPLIIGGSLLAGLAIDGRFQAAPVFETIPASIGGVLTAAGLGLIAVSLGLFRIARTRPEPWQPATSLIRSGVYRYTRNPMYLGMLLTHAGVAVGLRSPTAGLLLIPVFAIMDRLVVAREEAYLERRFGMAFERYSRSTRRWL
jgi:protein-S-isoprenylcysteine O-methyltransferase Ste14